MSTQGSQQDSIGTEDVRRLRERAASANRRSEEYSERLGALARFTLQHKVLVILTWVGLATALALVFPRLEMVVQKQSVQLIPRDVASFRTLDRMSAALDEKGSKTMLFVAMEDAAGLTLISTLGQTQAAARTMEHLRPLLDQLSAAVPAVDYALGPRPGLRPLAEQADGAIATIDPLVGSLIVSPWCATTPQCALIRDQAHVMVALQNNGFFSQVAELGDRVDPKGEPRPPSPKSGPRSPRWTRRSP
jgi:hypothetical protein